MTWVVGAERFYASIDEGAPTPEAHGLVLHRLTALPKVDIVTYEVISHRFSQICEEMGSTIRRVSGSPVATEATDFSTALSDEIGAGFIMGPYVVYHAVVLEYMIRWTLEHRTASPGIEPGDMFLCNDPWVGAAHQNDVAIYAPIFVDGKLFAWSGTTIHQVDVGGRSPGSFSIEADDVFGEQPPMPPIRIVHKNIVQADVEDVYVRRSRQPKLLRLDLRAQIAANNVASKRISELVAKFGADTVKTVIKEGMNRTEQKLRRRLQSLPDGTWRHVENVEVAKHLDRKVYQVHCAMTKSNDKLHFDFTGTHAQVGMINGASGSTWAGVLGVILTILAGDLVWATGAMRRVITLTNPRGTMINAEYPAAVSIASTSPISLVDNCARATVAKMLTGHPELRKLLLAGGGAGWPAVQIMGYDRDGQAFVTQLQDPAAMGFGARAWSDGVSTGGQYGIPAARIPNVEVTEQIWPMLVLYRSEVCDSGGAGRWRGGLGANFAFILHGTDRHFIHVSAAFGVAFPSNGGLSGGEPGNACRYLILRDSNVKSLLARGILPNRIEEISGAADLLAPKSQTVQRPDDVYEITLFGGAGFGDPIDRPSETVARDVRDGAVSISQARATYGVIIDSLTGAADTEATDARRAEIRFERLGGVVPLKTIWETTRSSSLTNAGIAFSQYLAILDGRVVCCKCGQDISSSTENYKLALASREVAIEALSPLNRPTSTYIDDPVVGRAFYCRGCATQVEFEICDARQTPTWDSHIDIPAK